MFMDALTGLYEAYLAECGEIARKKKPGEGIFGFGPKMGDEPCHDRFLEDLKAFLADVPQDRLVQTLEQVYRAPITYRGCENSAYWVLLAAHGLTLDRISQLSRQEASRLHDWYRAAFPRYERLPVQEQLLKALKKQSRN